MRYISSSVRKYLRELGSGNPVPGGGSASALSASLGISLLLMVISHAEKKLAAKRIDTRDLRQMKERLSPLLKRAEMLIDKDAVLFTKYLNALKTHNTEATESALIAISKPPLEICELSYKALETAEAIIKTAGRNIVSDVACGVSLLASAFKSSSINIEINRIYRSKADKQKGMVLSEKRYDDFCRRADAVISKSLKIIRGQ